MLHKDNSGDKVEAQIVLIFTCEWNVSQVNFQVSNSWLIRASWFPYAWSNQDVNFPREQSTGFFFSHVL